MQASASPPEHPCPSCAGHCRHSPRGRPSNRFPRRDSSKAGRPTGPEQITDPRPGPGLPASQARASHLVLLAPGLLAGQSVQGCLHRLAGLRGSSLTPGDTSTPGSCPPAQALQTRGLGVQSWASCHIPGALRPLQLTGGLQNSSLVALGKPASCHPRGSPSSSQWRAISYT